MIEQLFITPVASTAFVVDAVFQMLLGRRCSLSYSYESDENGLINFERLLFDGVEGFRCTYYTSCSLEMLDAYDRVLDIGRSDWLKEITSNLQRARENTEGLKHLRIYFDDGPCYEFICRSFEVLTEKQPL